MLVDIIMSCHDIISTQRIQRFKDYWGAWTLATYSLSMLGIGCKRRRNLAKHIALRVANTRGTTIAALWRDKRRSGEYCNRKVRHTPRQNRGPNRWTPGASPTKKGRNSSFCRFRCLLSLLSMSLFFRVQEWWCFWNCDLSHLTELCCWSTQ